MRLLILSCVSLFSLASNLNADQFHYNNVIIGERAQGMGGAYAGVADDASGVFYNPAGLAFAQSNDISGSANAYYDKKVTFKSALAGQDFVEKSGGSFAPFFGVMQKMEKTVSGLTAGFAFYTLDTELKDQDDLFENLSLSSTTNLKRYHRTANERASTYGATLAAGYRLSSNFSLGASLGLIIVDELQQIYQDAVTTSGKQVNLLTTNARQKLSATGFEPGIGAQATIGNSFSIGATVKMGQYLWQEYTLNNEVRAVTVVDSTAPITVGNSQYLTGLVCLNLVDESKTGSCQQASSKNKKPLGTMPMNARLGIAWFASQKLLVTTDVTYYGASSGGMAEYNRESVMNQALGMEYYITGSLPIRFGIFTNNDASPKITADSKLNMSLAHVDYQGGSLFLAWVQPNSQVALGGVYQQGTGKARKLGDTTIQDVSAQSITGALSATHSF